MLLVSAVALLVVVPRAAHAQDWKREQPGSAQPASDPVLDRVTALRQAAELLEKAAQIRARGHPVEHRIAGRLRAAGLLALPVLRVCRRGHEERNC